LKTIEGPWQVSFDPGFGGPDKPVVFDTFKDWSSNLDKRIKYYSGTALYSKQFYLDSSEIKNNEILLDLGQVYNIASIKVNGIDCGITWTSPYRLDITNEVNAGENNLEINVSNTWRNRLIGDNKLPKDERVTWTTAPFYIKGLPLVKAGLIGPVKILYNSSPY
jgi:hypothetical protein